MAQITLAQALKEKNRLTGEINRLWGLFQLENSCLATRTRSIDVAKTLQTIEHYTAKLVELKTKIGAMPDFVEPKAFPPSLSSSNLSKSTW